MIQGGGGGDKWPSSVYLYARERDAASSEMKAALQLVDGNGKIPLLSRGPISDRVCPISISHSGMQYEYDEYLSRSMQAVAAHMEAFDDFDITEEGELSRQLLDFEMINLRSNSAHMLLFENLNM